MDRVGRSGDTDAVADAEDTADADSAIDADAADDADNAADAQDTDDADWKADADDVDADADDAVGLFQSSFLAPFDDFSQTDIDELQKNPIEKKKRN